MTELISFEQRHGILDKPIVNDFPITARVALSYLIQDLINRKYIYEGHNQTPWDVIITELRRVARIGSYEDRFESYLSELQWLLEETVWFRIFTFCERVYSRFLTDQFSTFESLEYIRKYFTDEINQLLMEENIDFQFTGGQFERRGRAQTQKSIRKMGTVLADSNLSEVRKHYNKALKFFKQTPEPDYNNSIKEALCALESAIEIARVRKHLIILLL